MASLISQREWDAGLGKASELGLACVFDSVGSQYPSGVRAGHRRHSF